MRSHTDRLEFRRRLLLSAGGHALVVAAFALSPAPSARPLPSLVTVGATFLVHSLRGTPEPVLSTVPAAVLSPPAFKVWSWRVRRSGRSPWESGCTA